MALGKGWMKCLVMVLEGNCTRVEGNAITVLELEV